MSSYDSGDDFDGEIELFDITDLDSEIDSHSSETESAQDASDECESDDDMKEERPKRQAYLSLRQRRLSRALASFEGLKVNVNKAQRNWINAIRKARHMDDPWEQFHLDDYKVETCLRHRYNALRKAWLTDEVRVKMEKKVHECDKCSIIMKSVLFLNHNNLFMKTSIEFKYWLRISSVNIVLRFKLYTDKIWVILKSY